MSKPVRKVKSNGRTIVGYVPSLNSLEVIQHESKLEKDFIYILRFDPNVVSVRDQPLSIQYSLEGKKKTYTPDFLVEYKNGLKVLFEVKYTFHLEKLKMELRSKFAAGRKYAKENSIQFKIITEKKIRNEYTSNVIFLDQFRTDSVDLVLMQRITKAMLVKKECSGNELLSSIACDDSDFNQLIRPFWVLVFHGKICTNLFEKLTLNSIFWSCSLRHQRFLSYPYSSPILNKTK